MDAVETTIAENPVTRRPRLNAEGRIAQIRARIEEEWRNPNPDAIKIANMERTIDKIDLNAEKKRKTDSQSGAEEAKDAPETDRVQWIPKHHLDREIRKRREAEALAEYMRRVAVMSMPFVPPQDFKRILQDAKGENWNAGSR